MHSRLPALEDRPSAKLPRLSLEGSEASRPLMCLHNVGLMRWIYEEAKTHHIKRPSYKARQCDLTNNKVKARDIFHEVCIDVLAATRHCCRAYRAVKTLNEVACQNRQKKESRSRIARNMQKVSRKLLVAGIFCKMLRNIREENAKAEVLWKECHDGLASVSISSKAFGSSSRGLRSFRLGKFACGNISLGLRKSRNPQKSMEPDESSLTNEQSSKPASSHEASPKPSSPLQPPQQLQHRESSFREILQAVFSNNDL